MSKDISMRGRTFTGTVTSDKMRRTVTVEWTRRHYIPKYERYEKRKTSVKAHNPDEVDARTGDVVTIMETRPISKTKHFIIIKKHDAATSADAVSAEDVKQAVEEASLEEEPAKKPVKKTTKKAAKKPVKKTAKKEEDTSE